MIQKKYFNFSSNEKQTILRFSFTYILLITINIYFIGTTYYNSELNKELKEIENKKYKYIEEVTTLITKKLKPKENNIYMLSMYDNEYNIIDPKNKKQRKRLEDISVTEQGKIKYLKDYNWNYKRSQFLVFEINESQVKKIKNDILKQSMIYMLLLLLFFLIMGFFLIKLLIRPMKDAIVKMDNFIKDTTHELNTPINVITSNIEILKEEEIKSKELERIEIASKTITNIYEDLTYLFFKDRRIEKKIELKELIKKRILFFQLHLKTKNLKVEKQIKTNKKVNEYEFSKLFDNLITNAIKYNIEKGKIKIIVTNEYLTIKNTSEGLEDKEIKKITDRYERRNKIEGGFGIGLNIVKIISEENNWKIKISSSKEKKYFKIKILFKNY
jgi:two-component system OmpR family sensor kinase